MPSRISLIPPSESASSDPTDDKRMAATSAFLLRFPPLLLLRPVSVSSHRNRRFPSCDFLAFLDSLTSGCLPSLTFLPRHVGPFQLRNPFFPLSLARKYPHLLPTRPRPASTRYFSRSFSS